MSPNIAFDVWMLHRCGATIKLFVILRIIVERTTVRKLFLVLLVVIALFVFINAYAGVVADHNTGNGTISEAAFEAERPLAERN